MVAAILIAGIWGIWKALVQRRYTETAGALAVSVLFVLDRAVLRLPAASRTVGEASRATNTLSLAFLSGANRGSLDDPAAGQAPGRRPPVRDADLPAVGRARVRRALRHCVDTDKPDGDGFPRPVSPHDPARDVCRDHLEPEGRARRLRHPLPRAAAGSEERKAEYDALRDGELPFPMSSQFAGYRVDKADAPAVDIQQAGGAYQRLTFSVVVFIGALGAVVLLGTLVAGGDPRPGRRARAAGVRAGRARDRDLPAAPATTSSVHG